MGLVGEALERFGLVGARALGFEGLGQSWHGRSRHRALRPGKVQDDKKPEECEQDELREKMCALSYILATSPHNFANSRTMMAIEYERRGFLFLLALCNMASI